MNSTGNDIVALKAINVARTSQENFYKKVIAGSEHTLYNEPVSEKISFATFVWLLWSVKESAYKFLQRLSPALVFSPTKFVVNWLELPARQGMVRSEGQGFDHMAAYRCAITYGGQALHSCSLITGEWIFSVVSQDESFCDIYWGIQKIASVDPDAQSRAVRELLIRRLHAFFPESNLRVGKSPVGIPIVLNDDAEIPVPVSLAHHEHYVGYSFWAKKFYY
jgi:phosphopantetheinyl transferase (holo-ACP synthase)